MTSYRLPPVETKRLYQQIAALLRAGIDSGRYALGACLPPERELAEQLGVSRTSVREALIALEVEGRVAVKVGVGVEILRVANPGVASPAVQPEEPLIGPLDLLEARLVVEPEIAARASRHATAKDVKRLRALHAEMIDEHRRGGTRHVADRLFHLEIARIGGNAALAYLVAELWHRRQTAMQARLETLFGTSERFSAAQRDHEDILDAIARHDEDGAREAMRQHVARVHHTLSREIEGRS